MRQTKQNSLNGHTGRYIINFLLPAVSSIVPTQPLPSEIAQAFSLGSLSMKKSLNVVCFRPKVPDRMRSSVGFLHEAEP